MLVRPAVKPAAPSKPTSIVFERLSTLRSGSSRTRSLVVPRAQPEPSESPVSPAMVLKMRAQPLSSFAGFVDIKLGTAWLARIAADDLQVPL